MRTPGYIHERNFGCRLTEVIYRGLRMVTLENETLRVSILADKGCDVFEFLHKPTDTDFLWRSPLGVRNPAQFVPTVSRPDGAFLDFYEGGWQLCLPSGGNSSNYGGTVFGAHGEVCLIPWEYSILEDQPQRVSVRFWVRTYRTPLYIERVVTIERHQPSITMEERVSNEGEVAINIVWGHHPAFGPPFLDETCVVDLPGGVVETVAVEATHRCRSGKGAAWPLVDGHSGVPIDLSRIPSPDTRSHDLAYITDLTAGWYAITNTSQRVGFGLAWPVEIFPALWFWQVYGGALEQPWYGRTYNVALEPWTTPRPTITEALADGSQRTIEPGTCAEATLRAVAFTGLQRVTRVHPDGRVEGEAERR